MKDKNGNSIGINCNVNLIGDKDTWTVIGFDGIGGLNIKSQQTGCEISRHPSTLTVINK